MRDIVVWMAVVRYGIAVEQDIRVGGGGGSDNDARSAAYLYAHSDFSKRDVAVPASFVEVCRVGNGIADFAAGGNAPEKLPERAENPVCIEVTGVHDFATVFCEDDGWRIIIVRIPGFIDVRFRGFALNISHTIHSFRQYLVPRTVCNYRQANKKKRSRLGTLSDGRCNVRCPPRFAREGESRCIG